MQPFKGAPCLQDEVGALAHRPGDLVHEEGLGLGW